MLMLTTMNTRLQQFLAAENITQAQLADSLNVARAGVSHIIAGRNKPSYDFLSALMSHYPRLNVEWLMFGKGKMYKDRQEQSPAPRIESHSDLLFSEEDIFAPEKISRPAQEEEIRTPAVNSDENIRLINEIKNSVESMQVSVKQRNVSKIIILFDDGSFQEM